MAQEGLHNIKSKKLKGAVLKIDLSKAYDRVNWLYIRLLLTHLGFHLDLIRWIMNCLTTVSFVVLLNGAISQFFHSEQGLRQGCLLSPLLFLLVAEGLGFFLKRAHSEGDFISLPISQVLAITHLLFVDDNLIFCDGSHRDIQKLSQGLVIFKRASRMVISKDKLTINWANLEDPEMLILEENFNFQIRALDEQVKYLDFFLKPNDYRKADWYWLLAKIEKWLNSWSHRWLSRARRLVLVKLILEAMSVYWMALIWIPKGILEKIRHICFNFLWSGTQEKRVMPWAS